MRLRLQLALLWLGVMIALASAPSPDDPSSGALANAVHAVQYAVFALILLGLVRAARPRLPAGVPFALAGALALLTGAGQEWYQSFLPHREADPADLLYDALGVAAGLLLAALTVVFQHRRRPHRQRPLAAG